MKSVLDTIPKKVFDEKAHCIQEICMSTGRTRAEIEALRNDMLAAEEWEQVWKHYNGKVIRAYRLRKRK